MSSFVSQILHNRPANMVDQHSRCLYFTTFHLYCSGPIKFYYLFLVLSLGNCSVSSVPWSSGPAQFSRVNVVSLELPAENPYVQENSE